MPLFASQVPDPLGDQLPALVSPGRVAAPSIGVDLLVFIREERFKSATMEVQFNDIACGERLLWQVCEKKFGDDLCTRDADWALLFSSRMRGHDHARELAIGSYRNVWTVVEEALHLTLRALLQLIGWQVQARLNQWMMEQVIVFAAGYKRERGHIGKHRPIPVLAIQPEQRMRSVELIRRQILTNGRQPLAQFFARAPVATVAEIAEPLVTVRL